MSQAGWYPDPGGQAGRYRYWDGQSWSAVTTTSPATTPPPTPQGQSTQGQSTQGHSAQGRPGSPQSGQGYGPSAYQQYQQQSRRSRHTGWWIAGGAVVVALVLVAVFGIRALVSNSNELTGNPGSQSSGNVCPTNPYGNQTPKAQPNDGRVHGGQMSYPVLGAPWSAPQANDDRLPFATDVWTQQVMVQQNYDGKGDSWVASVLIGELIAGDGFFSPEDGSKIVTKCIVGAFYGDNTVQRHDKVNKAMSVDGKAGWLVESHLTFNIAGLKTKGELMIVLIVATSQESSSIYYASIPDTVAQLVAPAENAMKHLRVGP